MIVWYVEGYSLEKLRDMDVFCGLFMLICNRYLTSSARMHIVEYVTSRDPLHIT
jgi:hypothetical protein